MTSLILRVNHSTVDSPFVTAPSNFIDVAAADSFIFSAGSALVADGQALPSQADLNRAATLLSPTVSVIVAKYFLRQVASGLLREIYLAGNQNKQFVFCCSFDGATATEPQLEIWDNINLNTYAAVSLGASVPNSSWYKGVCTTLAAPGVGWTGTPLAGSGSSNIILLNNGAGALTAAKDLYFNLMLKIPAGVSTPGAESPILTVTYTTN